MIRWLKIRLHRLRHWLAHVNWVHRPGLLEVFARHLMLFKLTVYGKACLLGWLFAVALSFASLETSVHQVFTALTSLLVVSFVYAHTRRPRLRVTGAFPDKAVAGQRVEARYRVENPGSRAIRDVGVGYFDLMGPLDGAAHSRTLAYVEPGDKRELSIELVPRRRGVYTLPRLKAFTSFPFNLWRTAARLTSGPRASERLLVLPAFKPLPETHIPVTPRYQPGGVALTSNIGESPEYIGNRDYRPGDSVRHIDARSWARLARPIVREFQEEYYARVALILDTYVPLRLRNRAAGVTEMEAAVSLSAALADVLSRGEYLIDLFAAGPELHVFRAGRHTAHFENVLEILACIDPCRTDPVQRLTPALAEELYRISTVVAVLLDWDDSRKRLIEAALHAGAAVHLYLIDTGRNGERLERARRLVPDARIVPPSAILPDKDSAS